MVELKEFKHWLQDFLSMEVEEFSRLPNGYLVKMWDKDGLRVALGLDGMELDGEVLRVSKHSPQMTGEEIFDMIQEKWELLEIFRQRPK